MEEAAVQAPIKKQTSVLTGVLVNFEEKTKEPVLMHGSQNIKTKISRNTCSLAKCVWKT